ncbi:hypothetical protein Tco_0586468 [Tanacetum coccineum]
MSNTNNNLQTQTSNALHNVIMEAGGKDRPPMLAPDNYNPPYKFKWAERTIPVAAGSSETTTEGYMENYKNVSQDIRNQVDAEAKAVQIILTWIDNDIYSTVDACPNACEMWKSIERLKQGELINVQDLETILYKEFRKFTSPGSVDHYESYYSRTSRGTGYDNQRIVNVAGARETIVDWRDDTDDEPEDQKLEAHYLYMAKILEVTLNAADNSGPIFDANPLQKVQHDDDYNVFANANEHPTINSEEADQDDDDLARERDLLASLIDKLKCEIDDSKNRNKLLESSNKTLVDKLKGEIEDFKNVNKSLESSNNHFKEANNELAKTNQLMFKDIKKFQAELDRYHDVNYASNVEIDYVLAEVHNPDNMNKNMINHDVQESPSSEQSSVVNQSETEITNDSNIIPYSQYVKETQQAAIQNSNPSAQQDALILSVIEQLKIQVVNCTKINLENKSVNDTLTTELERYKEQVKVLKKGQNVDLIGEDKVSDSCEQSVKIDRLNQTLLEQLKEKESLMQTFTLLKNDFKNEESRNINREIALEKKIKQLDNIVYKRDQSAKTKAQQLEPKLYDGNVIKKTSAIVIPDSEETLMLVEESHLSPSCRPTKVEVPNELPKVSMVNTSLKKLKRHLAGFDVVVKERTTTTAITEGSWGFEHTKSCFRDEIIPFVKALKDLFNTFDQYLIDELSEVQNVFHQMEQAVEQHHLESKTCEIKMNQVLNENERLLEQVINKDIVNIIVNSSVNNASVNMNECEKCLKLETKLFNKKDFIEKETYDNLFRRYTTLEKHCISLEVDTQLNQEIFQRENSVSNESAPNFDQFFELN